MRGKVCLTKINSKTLWLFWEHCTDGCNKTCHRIITNQILDDHVFYDGIGCKIEKYLLTDDNLNVVKDLNGPKIRVPTTEEHRGYPVNGKHRIVGTRMIDLDTKVAWDI